MWWAFAVFGLVLVVVVALVAVQRVLLRLAVEPERNVFENDEAVEFVAQALPSAITAELSYEDLQRILRLHLDYLHREGVARSGGDLERGEGVKILQIQDGVAYVVERGALVEFCPAPDHVRQIIEAQLAYFEAIGAVSAVEEPDTKLEAEGLNPPA